jgi:hypothetical protein
MTYGEELTNAKNKKEQNKIWRKLDIILYKQKNYVKDKLNACRRRAKVKNLKFNLTEEIIYDLFHRQNYKCFYTGLSISDTDFSIDRINSNKGYTQDNVVLCLWKINKIKNDLDIYEFYKLCKCIVDHKCL